MSYTRFLYHIVFRTKCSMNVISESHEKDLYAYIYGFIKNKGAVLYRISGMPNHIHLLVDIFNSCINNATDSIGGKSTSI